LFVRIDGPEVFDDLELAAARLSNVHVQTQMMLTRRHDGRAGGTLGDSPMIERRDHIQHIYDKIGVSTRAAAALWAMQHGVVS